MSCKRLNDKGALKNIFSDCLWRDESVTCRENSKSVRIWVMTHLFFRLLNTTKKESEIIEQGHCKVPAAFIWIKAIGVVLEECICNTPHKMEHAGIAHGTTVGLSVPFYQPCYLAHRHPLLWLTRLGRPCSTNPWHKPITITAFTIVSAAEPRGASKCNNCPG